MKDTASNTVAKSLPQKQALLLKYFVQDSNESFPELRNIFVIHRWQNKVFFKKMKKKMQISML